MGIYFSSIEFYESLKVKYREYLKPEIVSIAILQSEDEVLLETVEIEIVEGGFEKQSVRRLDLGIIAEGETQEDAKEFFNPKDKIETNVLKFINELSPFTLMMTTDLFHEEAADKINRRFITFGIDK